MEEQGLTCYGFWNGWERKQSFTWRELEVIKRVLEPSVDSVKNRTVQIVCDNRNVELILKVGSKKLNIRDNTITDRLSKLSDCDDWSIKQVVFDYFDNRWGPHTCDRFASSYNNKCKLFNSKSLCAGTCWVDALEQVWVDHVN